MGFGLVADVVRHLKALGFVHVASDFRILTNSATQKLNCDEAIISFSSSSGSISGHLQRPLRSQGQRFHRSRPQLD